VQIRVIRGELRDNLSLICERIVQKVLFLSDSIIYLIQNFLEMDKPIWTNLQKIVFRFCFLFFTLNLFPFPLDPILGSVYEQLWDVLVPWGGKTFFNIASIVNKPNGSGDTTWNWIQVFLIFWVSVFGTLIWHFADRKRLNYNRLSYWFRIYIRYYLAITMFNYGFAKVFPSQFGTISNYRLHQQLGDMSPMGLLWTFMAYSTKYQFFSGLMECLGGFLLIFRRTALIGALITAGIMVNVFALNMCYDVPVKLYSFLLLLLAIYLASPDFKRLYDAFVLQKAVDAPTVSYMPAFLQKGRIQTYLTVGKIGVMLVAIGFLVADSFDAADEKAKSLTAFHGQYTVSKHVKNNKILTLTDSLCWEKGFISYVGYEDRLILTNEKGLRERFTITKVDSSQVFKLKAPQDTTKYYFEYQQPDSVKLVLIGKFKNDSLRIELEKQKPKDFLLQKRGFHWINEEPFNR
jgi:hypothetical protein